MLATLLHERAWPAEADEAGTHATVPASAKTKAAASVLFLRRPRPAGVLPAAGTLSGIWSSLMACLLGGAAPSASRVGAAVRIPEARHPGVRVGGW